MNLIFGVGRRHLLPFDYWKLLFMSNEIDNVELTKVLSNSLFLEALYLGSISLYNDFIKNGLTTKNRGPLLKYVIRASTRCTPFGLFASCFVFKFDDFTKLSLKKDSIDLFVFPTFQTKYYYYTKWLENKGYKNSFLTINNFSYFDDLEYRLYSLSFKEKVVQYELVKIPRNLIIDFIYNSVRNSPMYYIQLFENLLEHFEVSNDEIQFLLHNCILSQLIFPTEYFKLNSNDNLSKILPKEFDTIRRINCPEPKNIKKYKSIQSRVDYKDSNLFSSLSFSNLNESSVNYLIYGRLKMAISFLNSLFELKENICSKEFLDLKSNFIKRFEFREVELNKFFDFYIGVNSKTANFILGPDTILNKLSYKEKENISQSVKYNRNYSLLKSSIRHNVGRIIQIDISDFEITTEEFRKLPFCVLGSLVRNGNTEKFKLSSIGGTSSFSLFSRFYSYKEDIDLLISNLSNSEDLLFPNKIICEVIFSSNMAVNEVINNRNYIRLNILSMLGNVSDVDLPVFIPFDQLYISIRENRFYLRYNEYEIIPIISSAYNFKLEKSPIISFLAEYQNQFIFKNLFFPKDIFHDDVIFRPRVELNGIILHEATWVFRREAFMEFLNESDFSNSQLILSQIISLNNIDFIALFVHSDQEILLNFNNMDSINLFKDLISENDTIILKEFLDLDPILSDFDNKSYSNQLIIPFV